ncbi:MAG: DUF2149 domain-containing protein [Oscillospiraceae bacterium]|jgi:hypothetical protein|nr:DUF2149 domain-containing protein [Oscillospiraceae bacterium]
MLLKNNRFGEDIFSGGGINPDGGINPMDGVANLADIMLVLACGLMLALVINWNVRLSADADATATPPDNVTPMEEIEPAPGGESNETDTDGYMEVGRVYRDPATGKLYLVADDGAVDIDGVPSGA